MGMLEVHVLLGHNVTQRMLQSGIFVASDMSLSLLSIVFNLMLLTSLRERESLLSVKYNLVLANLCLSNLVSSVLVKSVSIVHYGHAVATSQTESSIAFCYVYTTSFRCTWAVLPWSLVFLSWCNISNIFAHIKDERLRAGENICSEDGGSMGTGLFSSTTEQRGLDEEGSAYKLTMQDKVVLVTLWLLGVVNSLLSGQVLSKEQDQACSIEDKISSTLNLASICLILVLPLFLGPVFLVLSHLAFFIFRRLTGCTNCTIRPEKVPSASCLGGLSLIFLVSYVSNMALAEQEEVKKNVFLYVMLKYILGTAHQFFTPLWVLISRKDIWETTVFIYRKGGTTQSKSLELTYEQIQRELGLGGSMED